MASLQLLTGERTGEVIELKGDSLSLGRARENDLSIATDARLGRHHARIERKGTDWLIEDLGSVNGTTIERAGSPIRVTAPTPLVNGDVIVAGSLRAGVALDPVPEEQLETMVLDVASDKTVVAAPQAAVAQPASLAPAQAAETDDSGDFERTRVLRAASYTPLGKGSEELLPASAPGLRPAHVASLRKGGHRLLATLIVLLPALILALVALYFAGIR